MSLKTREVQLFRVKKNQARKGSQDHAKEIEMYDRWDDFACEQKFTLDSNKAAVEKSHARAVAEATKQIDELKKALKKRYVKVYTIGHLKYTV